MKAFWRRFVAFGFRLLYNELAWLYDPVSWVVSKGLWRDWQRTALRFLPASGTVLEVAFGPGHLLRDLVEAGYQSIGLDLSRAMLRQAAARNRQQGLAIPLCRGDAMALPFAADVFDAVVVTFPTPFVYDAAWLQHIVRVLRNSDFDAGQGGGRLIVVEMTSFRKGDPPTCGLEWLFRITGQRGPTPDLPALLAAQDLTTWREMVEVNGSTVSLVLAEKR
jgi:demethylmenaquinone methyltransferase/2-methoxy-6-polyprenyl-1,4-benzoquinol methylase